MADLHGTQRQYTLVITTSLLMMTISTPIWGKLSDLFDKKVMVQLAIALFVAGSLIAGFAVSIPMMMVARVIQGTAMGGLMALVQSIMGTILAPRERGRYAGYMGGVMGIATVSGPLLGGVITDGMGVAMDLLRVHSARGGSNVSHSDEVAHSGHGTPQGEHRLCRRCADRADCGTTHAVGHIRRQRIRVGLVAIGCICR